MFAQGRRLCICSGLCPKTPPKGRIPLESRYGEIVGVLRCRPLQKTSSSCQGIVPPLCDPLPFTREATTREIVQKASQNHLRAANFHLIKFIAIPPFRFPNETSRAMRSVIKRQNVFCFSFVLSLSKRERTPEDHYLKNKKLNGNSRANTVRPHTKQKKKGSLSRA